MLLVWVIPKYRNRDLSTEMKMCIYIEHLPLNLVMGIFVDWGVEEVIF